VAYCSVKGFPVDEQLLRPKIDAFKLKTGQEVISTNRDSDARQNSSGVRRSSKTIMIRHRILMLIESPHIADL